VSDSSSSSSLELVPNPRRLMFGGGSAPLDARPAETQSRSLPAQGFELTIDGGVRIAYADDAGLRYARGLLDQIRSQSIGTLPGLRARDWPDFPIRSYMLDISRDRVPTRETLERIVDLLTLVRINELQLYTEHTYAFRDHKIVWRDASPMAPDDIRWLDKLCIGRGIDLVPNQNCFGHMNRWLMHDAYRSRAECPEGSKAPWGAELPPWTLAPTEENARFALDLFNELLVNFSSNRVNIGCDEPFDLGQGVSQEEVERRGKTEVYLEHLERIARPLVKNGYEVLVWGDILREDPALAAKVLPDGVTAVPWHYEQVWPEELRAQVPEQALQALAQLDQDPLDGFRAQMEALAGIDIPIEIAPGTATWNSLIGRIDNAYGNLVDAALQGREFGAKGFLITDWGDNGHHQPPIISYPPIVYGGAVSWCLEANRSLDVANVLDTLVLDQPMGQQLDAIGRLWSQTGQLAFNGSPIFRGLVPRSTMSFGEINPSRCNRVIELLDEVMHGTPTEIYAACRLARHGVWRMLRHIDAERPDDAALRSDLGEAIELQREAWLAVSRPGGLNDSIGRLERSLAEYG